jgi:hypothetical protein
MKYFKVEEFACKDSSPYPKRYVSLILEPFVELVLDPIREAYGAPLEVTSGYRTDFWNHAVGGAHNSRHRIREVMGKDGHVLVIGGDAADIAPLKQTNDRVKALRVLIEEMVRDGKLPKLGGYGGYVRWAHVDARPRKPDGRIYTWKGSGIGSEK